MDRDTLGWAEMRGDSGVGPVCSGDQVSMLGLWGVSG